VAIAAWRKQQRVELLKTIAVVVASSNPEKAAEALNNLIQEMFPEIKADRQKSVDRALAIMRDEMKKGPILVRPLEDIKSKSVMPKVRSALLRRRPCPS
jgi:flagellar motor switch protein FliG